MSHCAHDSDLSPTVPDFSPNFAANLRNTFAKLRPQLSIIEQSPYTTDVALELERIKAEKETGPADADMTKETGGNTGE